MDTLLTYLQEVEERAEEVLGDRRQIVDLDVKRNRNREALRALCRDPSETENVTVCFGDMFLSLPRCKTQEMIERDQSQLDTEIDHLRSQLKVKLNKLYEAQGKPEIKGFNLTPLMPEEMSMISKVMGGNE